MAQGSSAGAAKNVVLVHGAFADESSGSKVVPLLKAKGLRVTTAGNPLTSSRRRCRGQAGDRGARWSDRSRRAFVRGRGDHHAPVRKPDENGRTILRRDRPLGRGNVVWRTSEGCPQSSPEDLWLSATERPSTRSIRPQTRHVPARHSLPLPLSFLAPSLHLRVNTTRPRTRPPSPS